MLVPHYSLFPIVMFHQNQVILSCRKVSHHLSQKSQNHEILRLGSETFEECSRKMFLTYLAGLVMDQDLELRFAMFYYPRFFAQ